MPLTVRTSRVSSAMLELIDVLTVDGRSTGTQKSKAQIHRDGDWHRAAHVWVVAPDGRVLLQRRSFRKENNPGLWDVSAAGHLSAGESAIEAAVRETREEIGLAISTHELKYLATMPQSCVLNEGTYFDNEIHEIFLLRREVDLRSLTLDPEEVAEVKWVRELRPDETFVPHGEEYALVASTIGRLR